MLFQGIGFATKDPEWNLERDGDAAELGERTLAWFESIDKKKSAAWEKRIATWQPLLALLMALIMIVGPRIMSTREKRRNAVNLQKANGGGNGTAPNGNGTRPTATPVQGHSGEVPSGTPGGPADVARTASNTIPNTGANPPRVHTGPLSGPIFGRPVERSFRRTDWGEQSFTDD